jgi:hypothetical protein
VTAVKGSPRGARRGNEVSGPAVPEAARTVWYDAISRPRTPILNMIYQIGIRRDFGLQLALRHVVGEEIDLYVGL